MAIYEPLVYRLARRKGLQDADARDVCQEVLRVVSQAVGTWDPARGGFRAWLSRVTRNLLINFLTRRPSQFRGSGATSIQDLLEAQPAPDPAATAIFEAEYRKHEIKEVIGRGGMGVVLKAFDPALNRTVAIKVLSASMATCGAARRRFLREARAAAAVAHEHVVAVHAVVESAGLPFLVMEYVPGRSLQERLDNDGPLGLEEILRIGMQTAAGLAAAHAQGLVHRDVKPANILLENGVERVRLTDFGLARAAADASVTQSGLVAGTPHYMAPEQARGEATDHRADLFSLGSTLYAMCTGHPPFRADSAVAVLRRVSDDLPRPVREINSDLPEWLEAIISRFHAKSPAERFKSAAEVADLLSRCLAHTREPLSVALPAAVSSPDLRRKARRRHNLKWAALVLAASLVVVIAMAAPAWRHLQEVPSEANLVRPGDNAMDLHSSQSPARGAADDFEAQLEAARKHAAMIERDLNAPSSSTVANPLSVRIRDLATEARLLEQELVTGSTVPKH